MFQTKNITNEKWNDVGHFAFNHIDKWWDSESLIQVLLLYAKEVETILKETIERIFFRLSNNICASFNMLSMIDISDGR
jgi:hypothetical protein